MKALVDQLLNIAAAVDAWDFPPRLGHVVDVQMAVEEVQRKLGVLADGEVVPGPRTVEGDCRAFADAARALHTIAIPFRHYPPDAHAISAAQRLASRARYLACALAPRGESQ